MDSGSRELQRHRHGSRVHSHPHTGPHRHLSAPRLSRPRATGAGHTRAAAHANADGHADAEAHPHSHGLVDDSIKRSREGIRAIALSLAVLGLTAAAQTAIFVASGSVALLADLIHNYGDALTALPLGIAFALRSAAAERNAGVAVVAAIFVSACVAGAEALARLLDPSAPTHLLVLAGAGAIGFAGNWVAARIRTRAGRRLASPALIADGEHARADSYVSLAVVASSAVVALGVPVADPLIGLVICAVILRITWHSWQTIRGHHHRSGGDSGG
jgi:divalent metal cation (Fe/Co/Zn/Cd) transporter